MLSALHLPPEPGRATPSSLRDMLARLEWRGELLSILLILAEASLVYLFVGFALPESDSTSSVLPAWIVVMLMLTAHLVPHLLDEWRVWSPTYEAILVAAIALTMLVAAKAGSFSDVTIWDTAWLRGTFDALAFLSNDSERPVWGIVFLGMYAWWRGRTRAEGTIDSAYSMMRVGTFVMAVLLVLILASMSEDAQVRDRLSVSTIAFFACSLAAIGVARLKLEGFRTSAPLGPRWLATFVGPILAVIAVAIIGAGIFSRQFLDTILWMLTPVFFVLNIVFQVFVLILAIIAFILLSPIVWLIGAREPQLVPVTPTALGEQDRSGLQEVTNSPFQVPDPLRYLIAALVLFVIFSLLTRFVFRRRRKERGSTEEERESVLEWGNLFGALGDRLRGLRRKPVEEDPLAHLRDDPRWRHTLTIRETYMKLQERGALAGRPRRPPETADEYRPGIATRFSSATDVPAAIAAITDTYRHIRYSGSPATEQEATTVLNAWALLERAE
ncbi:MAG: DUF4129 domain-containing protein [Thermomicrobiales bacterium]